MESLSYSISDVVGEVSKSGGTNVAMSLCDEFECTDCVAKRLKPTSNLADLLRRVRSSVWQEGSPDFWFRRLNVDTWSPHSTASA